MDSREPTWHTVALIRAAVTSWTKGDLRHAEGMAGAAWRTHTDSTWDGRAHNGRADDPNPASPVPHLRTSHPRRVTLRRAPTRPRPADPHDVYPAERQRMRRAVARWVRAHGYVCVGYQRAPIPRPTSSPTTSSASPKAAKADRSASSAAYATPDAAAIEPEAEAHDPRSRFSRSVSPTVLWTAARKSAKRPRMTRTRGGGGPGRVVRCLPPLRLLPVGKPGQGRVAPGGVTLCVLRRSSGPKDAP